MASIVFALGAIILLMGVSVYAAPKYNLTKAQESSLVMTHDRPTADCSVPGVCVPVNQTIEARTMWYWCGLRATHRTTYVVTSNSANNLTGMFLMRQQEVEGCALANVTMVGDDCKTIPESSCSGKKTCDVRVFGLSFPDPVCLVIINNRGSSIVATMQVTNVYDSPRYYGTVFVLVFTIAGGLAIVANVAYQFYTIILAPVSKHPEQIKVKRADASAGHAQRQDAAERGAVSAMLVPAINGVAPSGKVNGLYSKIVTQLKEKLGAAESKHQA